MNTNYLPESIQEALLDPERDLQRDYRIGDIEHVFLEGGDFASWDDVLDWLSDIAADESELSAGQAAHMYVDFIRLSDADVPFTNNPQEAYHLAKEHRPD